jgi:hypothetical protein
MVGGDRRPVLDRRVGAGAEGSGGGGATAPRGGCKVAALTEVAREHTAAVAQRQGGGDAQPGGGGGGLQR